jgi:hypothetical protein
MHGGPPKSNRQELRARARAAASAFFTMILPAGFFATSCVVGQPPPEVTVACDQARGGPCPHLRASLAPQEHHVSPQQKVFLVFENLYRSASSCPSCRALSRMLLRQVCEAASAPGRLESACYTSDPLQAKALDAPSTKRKRVIDEDVRQVAIWGHTPTLGPRGAIKGTKLSDGSDGDPGRAPNTSPRELL